MKIVPGLFDHLDMVMLSFSYKRIYPANMNRNINHIKLKPPFSPCNWMMDVSMNSDKSIALYSSFFIK